MNLMIFIKMNIKELETALSQQKSRSDMLEEKVRRLTLRQTRVENTV